jgi:hypothetical protein
VYVTAVKDLAAKTLEEGLDCWFNTYGLCKYPGQPFDWGNSRTPMSFSGHHIERVMDGGAAVVDISKLVPAHRGCNAADGLRAQNNRRAAHKRGEVYDPTLDDIAILHALSGSLTTVIPMDDPTSRDW